MSTVAPYQFLKQLVVRLPALPFANETTVKDFEQLLQEEDFLEAIYLASPVLYKECIKFNNSEITDAKELSKIKASVIKYYQRMYSRCTPFGLFSGCSVVDWSGENTQVTVNTKEKKRHTRLDMHYLCALSLHIAKLDFIKNRLLYYPNNSIYKTADEIRYVEYKYENGRRIHQISAVMASDYLEQLLQVAEHGITIEQMQELLQKEDVSVEEAQEFIEELLEAQLLTNDLEPSITGNEFIYQLIQVLQKINQPTHPEISKLIYSIQQIEEKLKGIDANVKNSLDQYKEIITIIESLGVAFEENKLFQTDLVHATETALLNDKHQADLMDAIKLLNGLFTSNTNEQLEFFAKRYYERYEDKELPLLQVLDAETGIGYLDAAGKNITPLLNNIAVPLQEQGQNSIGWSKTQQWLFTLLKKAALQNAYNIEVKEEDIKDNKLVWDDLPPSISIMFRLLDDEKLLIENIGGSSAANLLARFAHADHQINKLVQEIATQEQEMNPNIVFAEIVHLPESRVGNILLHPKFRNYEMPYLAQSSLPPTQQIKLGDIYISVQNNTISLRSKKLQKEIIPRLSSAHNFSFNALPVYQFLCDLQTQKLRSGFSFYWGNLSGEFTFLPRITYKNVILKEATWQFNKSEIEQLVKSLKEQNTQFIKLHRLPRLVVLADGDNELLLDIENKNSILAFIDAIKNRTVIVLKELLEFQNVPIRDDKQSFFINQFIATLVKTTPTYHAHYLPNLEIEKVQREFVPGTEWFYCKLYCGAKSADKILEEFIVPLKNNLLDSNVIDNWFFIRYTDPQFHLRIRFHTQDIKQVGKLIELCGATFHLLQEQGLVWKVQIDTYKRELERYGGALCEVSEQLFGIDSNLKLLFLQATEGDDREHIRWLWGMKNIDWLLNCFQYTLPQKEELMQYMCTSFAQEFNFGKISLQSINKKYATHRKEIEQLFNEGQIDSLLPVELFAESTLQMEKVAAFIKDHSTKNALSLNTLMSSYIHMSLNRLFLSESRLQEAVLYDFLHKWYVSLRHRKNNT